MFADKMKSQSEMIKEIEDLRQANMRLTSTVQELRLEISYYLGEAKKNEWEKDLLKQEMKNMQALFRNWVSEIKSSSRSKRIFDDPDLISLMADFPTRPIPEMLQHSTNVVLLTTCQEPFFIEYANVAWVNVCGWHTHEICGLPCKFLQGELTDKKVSATFMDDVREIGYARMRILNYRKDGSKYSATVTVFPVFDSISPESESPILTHFAAILSSISDVTTDLETSEVNEDIAEMEKTEENCGITETEQSERSYEIDFVDRRTTCLQYNAPCHITPDNFIRFCATVRLSDLLRFALSCQVPLVITDENFGTVHINKAWNECYDYTLVDVENENPINILLRDYDPTSEFHSPSSSTQYQMLHYSRDGSPVDVLVTTMPIKGGIKNTSVTHYCVLMSPTATTF